MKQHARIGVATPVWPAERGLWGADLVVQLTVRTNCNHEVSMKIWVWLSLNASSECLLLGEEWWREAFLLVLVEADVQKLIQFDSAATSRWWLWMIRTPLLIFSAASQAADWASSESSKLRSFAAVISMEEKQSKRWWSGDILKSEMKYYEMVRIIWIEMIQWYIRSAGVYKNSKPFNALTVSQLSRGPSSVMWQVLERIPEAPALLLAGFSTDRRELLDPVQTLRASIFELS